ncbi:hypothetical protein GFM96_09560 [Salmonella enterica]|nr:hypothetical protein [Salmonella enterica]
MSNRIANISTTHLASLAGMESGIKEAFGVKDDNYNDKLIFTAMVQAGVKKIRLVGGEHYTIVNSGFMKGRYLAFSFEEYFKIFKEVEDTIKDNVIVDENDDVSNKIWNLTWFLSELIFALRTKSSMVSVLPFPKVNDYIGLFRPQLISSIGILFEKINVVNLKLPVPQKEILSSDIKKFNEVLNSDLYGNYSLAHEELEFSYSDDLKIIANIENKAFLLRNYFENYIDIKKLSMSIIPITVKVIDDVCGKIPGALANTLGNALSQSLSDTRRITIYDYGDVHKELMVNHYAALSKLKK